MTWKIANIKKMENTSESKKTDSNLQNSSGLGVSNPVVSLSQKGPLALFRDFLLVGGDLV